MKLRTGPAFGWVRTSGARWAACVLAVAILPWVFEPRADAQQRPASSVADAEARSLYEAGTIAFRDARFADALGYFRHAHQLSPRPQLLYNIGVAAERLQHDEEALEAFEQYLAATGPGADNRRDAEARVSALRESVARDREARARADVTPAAPIAEPAVVPIEATPADHGDGDIVEQWWFWTIIGVVVVGAGVGIGLGVALGGRTETAVQIPGDVGPGGTISALSGITALSWQGP